MIEECEDVPGGLTAFEKSIGEVEVVPLILVCGELFEEASGVLGFLLTAGLGASGAGKVHLTIIILFING